MKWLEFTSSIFAKTKKIYIQKEIILKIGSLKTKEIRDVIEIFKQIGFKIDMKTNLEIIDFLEGKFNLEKVNY